MPLDAITELILIFPRRQEADEPLLTCEAVLAEAAFHLRDSALVLRMVREGLVGLAMSCDDHWTELQALAERYADRAPDLADLCLIRLSELHPKHSVSPSTAMTSPSTGAIDER